jgi:LDH2 family malate/lactate/ureidoglycolate dehydrogenase
MFECLSSLMAGNPLLVPSLLGEGVKPGTQNSFVAALDIGFFTDVEEYRRNVDQLAAAIKGLPLAAGAGEILVPGEKENQVRAERLREGIPLPPGTVDKLRAAAERFGLELPAGLV